MTRPPPLFADGVAADGAVGQRGRAVSVVAGHRRRRLPGGVAADGAVGQRGRAVFARYAVEAAAGFGAAELPLTVQLVSVVVPSLQCETSAAATDSRPVLPLTVQLVSVVVAPMLDSPPPDRWRSCR